MLQLLRGEGGLVGWTWVFNWTERRMTTIFGDTGTNHKTDCP